MSQEEKILYDLIRIDSQTNKSNSEIISYIQNQYKNLDSQKQSYLGGENLIVKIEGRSKESPLLIACHTDTVVANGNWTANPFVPRRLSGEIIGLGACDMKGSLACVVASTKKIGPQNRDIYLIFDGSEEDKSQGATEVVKNLPNIRDATVLIPEPTKGLAYLSQRGYFDFYIYGKHIERKLEPEDDSEIEFIRAMKEYPNVEIRGKCFWNPSYFCNNPNLIREIKQIGLSISSKPFPGWTEAAIFSKYGPAFIFGAGDYSKAHKPDESIRSEDLGYFSMFLKKMITYK